MTAWPEEDLQRIAGAEEVGINDAEHRATTLRLTPR
jgi:hypothetical protein